jgi:T-complex protein 1 subunit alpha
MATMFEQPRDSTLFLGGTKVSGADVRDQNGRALLNAAVVWLLELTGLAVMAAQAIANVVKTSFGPSGLDKMMVDDIGVRLPCPPSSLARADRRHRM